MGCDAEYDDKGRAIGPSWNHDRVEKPVKKKTKKKNKK